MINLFRKKKSLITFRYKQSYLNFILKYCQLEFLGYFFQWKCGSDVLLMHWLNIHGVEKKNISEQGIKKPELCFFYLGVV